jgi:hypothetical protein
MPFVEYKTIYKYVEDDYKTELVEYEPGCWEVITYVDEEIVNNTGTIDNYQEAEYDFRLHLDLYYQKTLEEIK